jgi:hypothetical protein
MAVYLVTYDLKKETVRPKITDAIHKLDGWAQLSESSYAVVTDDTPEGVYRKLLPLLDENDQLFVMLIRRPWAGQGEAEVKTWLRDQLP